MENDSKKSYLAKIPSWVLALIIFVLSIIIAFVLEYVQFPGTSVVEIIELVFYVVFIPIACFVISKAHPKSLWYTPFICNPVAGLGTVFHPLAWTTLEEYLFWVFSLALSIFGSYIGAKVGQRKLKQA